MTISILTRSTIINGANSLAVAIKNGIVYRLQPVEEMQPIILEGFEKNTPRIFQLADVLDQDYKIVGVTLDIPQDDSEGIDQYDPDTGKLKVKANIRIVRKDKSAQNVQIELTSYFSYTNPLYIDHNDVWKIELDKDVNSISLRCVPVIINTPKRLS